MIYKIEVLKKFGLGESNDLKTLASFSGINLDMIEIIDVYFIKGNISYDDADFIAKNIIVDPVIEEYIINDEFRRLDHSILVALKPSVFDSTGETLLKICKTLNIKIENAKTGKRYNIRGKINNEQKNYLIKSILSNPVIEDVIEEEEKVFINVQDYNFIYIEVPILDAKDEELLRISEDGVLSLSLDEMKAIKKYFMDLGRNPSDCELETIAQTWSEHCFHKTFKADMILNGANKGSLFKDYIKKATHEISSPICLSVFKDNAGVIEFDNDYGVTFKVETHNHPSAIEPYGGAGTGIGGVIRDTIGTGKGARPIANTDIFCFPNPDSKSPNLSPRRIIRGVVKGVADYGNRMGIPTVNGAIIFNDDFLFNPLVFCGSVGIIKKKDIEKKVETGDLILLVGGRTGRDGIHGATFSSKELDSKSFEKSITAVQIGNPIEEKKMLDCIMKATEEGLVESITDCGAGGLSSAIGEMGKKTGAEVHLEKVPLKYKGLSYTEIWISESQERMVIAVDSKNLERIIKIFEEGDVEATVLGKFTKDKKLRLYYEDKKVCELDMDFLHNGIPKRVLNAKIKNREEKKEIPYIKNYEEIFLKLISLPDIASKEWVIRQYDHEVQGGSVVKPINPSPQDSAVVKPILNSNKVLVISNGINPNYGKINPYWMAASCIDEALRNNVACGGDLDKAAMLDNFCFGDVEDEYVLGDLLLTAKGCYDFAKYYRVPFISGKDSLNNKYKIDEEVISIPPTLLISAISVIDEKEISTADFKEEGNLIYLIGQTKDEFGGSQISKIIDLKGEVPKIDINFAREILIRIRNGIRKNLFQSVHDISDGGFAVSIVEMCFANGIGAEIKLVDEIDPFVFLFSESNSRFIVEVRISDKDDFEKFFLGLPFFNIGKTIKDYVKISYDKKEIVKLQVQEIFKRYREGIKW